MLNLEDKREGDKRSSLLGFAYTFRQKINLTKRKSMGRSECEEQEKHKGVKRGQTIQSSYISLHDMKPTNFI